MPRPLPIKFRELVPANLDRPTCAEMSALMEGLPKNLDLWWTAWFKDNGEISQEFIDQACAIGCSGFTAPPGGGGGVTTSTSTSAAAPPDSPPSWYPADWPIDSPTTDPTDDEAPPADNGAVPPVVCNDGFGATKTITFTSRITSACIFAGTGCPPGYTAETCPDINLCRRTDILGPQTLTLIRAHYTPNCGSFVARVRGPSHAPFCDDPDSTVFTGEDIWIYWHPLANKFTMLWGGIRWPAFSAPGTSTIPTGCESVAGTQRGWTLTTS